MKASKTLIMAFCVSLACLLIGYALGYVKGMRDGQFLHALQENKVAKVNLTRSDVSIAPQLREYLKTRLYSNVERYFPTSPGYLIRSDWDVGPVNTNVLGSICTYKEYSCYDWDMAVRDK